MWARKMTNTGKIQLSACEFECNANYNVALNILAAGHAVTACGAGKGSSARDESGTRL